MLTRVDQVLTQQSAARAIDLSAEDIARAKRVFGMLHGFYGNLVISKFSTGEVEDGVDQGMLSTLRVWAFGLRRFDEDTIQAALNRVRRAHKEFPPGFPEFEELLLACRPRGVAAPRGADGALLLGMSPKLRSSYARRAREINARHDEAARAARAGAVRQVEPGLQGLKELVARAVGEAGGDEAAELLRLDRMFTRKDARHVGGAA